jgi:four helix bundle protein
MAGGGPQSYKIDSSTPCRHCSFCVRCENSQPKTVMNGHKAIGTKRAHSKTMAIWDLADRTMRFAVETFRFCRCLPRTDEAREVSWQLRRSASSAAANYRAAKRGRSDEEFVSKIGQVIEEAEESVFWFDFLAEAEIVKWPAITKLRGEGNELVSFFVTAKKTAKARLEAKRAARREERKRRRRIDARPR